MQATNVTDVAARSASPRLSVDKFCVSHLQSLVMTDFQNMALRERSISGPSTPINAVYFRPLRSQQQHFTALNVPTETRHSSVN
jgi:hypothetical protein